MGYMWTSSFYGFIFLKIDNWEFLTAGNSSQFSPFRYWFCWSLIIKHNILQHLSVSHPQPASAPQKARMVTSATQCRVSACVSQGWWASSVTSAPLDSDSPSVQVPTGWPSNTCHQVSSNAAAVWSVMMWQWHLVVFVNKRWLKTAGLGRIYACFVLPGSISRCNSAGTEVVNPQTVCNNLETSTFKQSTDLAAMVYSGQFKVLQLINSSIAERSCFRDFVCGQNYWNKRRGKRSNSYFSFSMYVNQYFPY